MSTICLTFNPLRHFSARKDCDNESNSVLCIDGATYPKDDATNVPSTILSKLSLHTSLHLQPSHPLSTIRHLIQTQPQFSTFLHFNQLPAVVSPERNFDHLLIPADHPSRSGSDTFYLNRDWLLRTHTSAHQSELLVRLREETERVGSDKVNGFLMSGDVYRKDQIDATHYPVFHQMEGIQIFRKGGEARARVEQLKESYPILHEENIFKFEATSGSNGLHSTYDKSLRDDAVAVVEHLKMTLFLTVQTLWKSRPTDRDVTGRFNADYFPFTQPSYEMELFENDVWLEILGGGVIRPEILDRAGNAEFLHFHFLECSLFTRTGSEPSWLGLWFGAGTTCNVAVLYPRHPSDVERG
jgi:phenylalanyl-tRNA synthetase alpha chain